MNQVPPTNQTKPAAALAYATPDPMAAPFLTPKMILQKLGPLIGLAFVTILFSILRPRTFLTVDNLQIILLLTAVVATAALGATMIIISGGIDLSAGSNIALCTVVIAQALLHGWPPLLAALAGIVSGSMVGLVIGMLVTQLNLKPFIVTLGLWGAVRGFAKVFADETTVESPTTWLNSLLSPLQPGQHWMIVPPGVWITVILTICVAGLLRYTRFGRHIFAIGSNEQTAILCGVRVDRTKILIYFVATLFVGVAGLLQFSFLTIGDPTTANGKELDVIAACVIGGCSLNGGQGSIVGTIIGALIMTVVSNGCTKVGLEQPYQDIVTGGIIILAVTLDQMRQGKKTNLGTMIRRMFAKASPES
jgi:ribose/xylose/arabinose/galactoside ABC-type transport system permease subunit